MSKHMSAKVVYFALFCYGRDLNCRIQELATPARGVTSIKFITRISRRAMMIHQQDFIVKSRIWHILARSGLSKSPRMHETGSFGSTYALMMTYPTINYRKN